MLRPPAIVSPTLPMCTGSKAMLVESSMGTSPGRAMELSSAYAYCREAWHSISGTAFKHSKGHQETTLSSPTPPPPPMSISLESTWLPWATTTISNIHSGTHPQVPSPNIKEWQASRPDKPTSTQSLPRMNLILPTVSKCRLLILWGRIPLAHSLAGMPV